jgi:hypothetical protein
MKKTLYLSILWVLMYSVYAQASETVTAKGLSFFEPGREVVAREKALDEAKRMAIEKAMGTVIESRTIVENFQVVKDEIFSRSSGYLKDIQIISEKKSDLGTYEVEIEATVEVAVLVDDIDRFQNLLKWQKNPRVKIILEPGMIPSSVAAAKKSANLLTAKLRRNGFKVFKDADNQELQMGLLVGLIIEHASMRSTYQDIELTLNEISLSANVYRPTDGEILATSSAVKTLPGENKLQALDKGAKFCIDAIWRELRAKLIRLWEKELYSERDIFLIVKAIDSHARAQEIAGIFETDVSGVRGIQLVNFNKDVAEYNLRYRGRPDQLLNEMEMGYFKNNYFDSDLIETSGNKLVIMMK